MGRFALSGLTLLAIAGTGDRAWGAVAGAGGRSLGLAVVRREIAALEKDLLQTKESQASAAGQLRKIRKLLSLQQKEIEISRKRIDELGVSMGELDARRSELATRIDERKSALRRLLRTLDVLGQREALDASWLSTLDADNEKTYFLSRRVEQGLAGVARLKRDADEARALEARITDERNRLDYYVQELRSQAALLSANEGAQREILKTNRASRLEALRRVQDLRESERALESMLGSLGKERNSDAGFATLKGRLPPPVEGIVLSFFGKFYDRKTSLLTFQKGITMGSPASAEVKAVAGGRVVFAGPLKSYGLVAILEHPGQYYSLYGQMGSVAVAEGASVASGETLGRTAAAPLYFEIRNRNVAINPLQWLGNNSITLSRSR